MVTYRIDDGVLIISEGISVIPKFTFACNDTIKSVIVPEGVEYIEYDVFRYCKNLASIQLPSTLRYIGHNAFNGCTALNSIMLPNHLETIGAYSFKDCTSLERLVIPNSVTMIYGGAFQGSGLISVDIGSSVHIIREDTFRECRRLEEIMYSPGTRFSINAFTGCINLKSYPTGLF